VPVHTAIVTDPIDGARVLARVGAREDGAALLFLGIVRDHNDGRPVGGMRYDAYVEMAEGVLTEIAGEVAATLGTDRVAIEHRIGRLDIGEASVAIAVSSPHRAEAFDACRQAIEQIKLRLPVWKREEYLDGESRWLDGQRPPVQERAR